MGHPAGLIQAINADDVALAIAAERSKGFTLLQLGSFSLLSVNREAAWQRSDAMMHRAYHVNQVVPANSSKNLLIFFPRSALSNAGQTSSLHLLVRPASGAAGPDGSTESAIVSFCTNIHLATK
jgi:hypothetical protein